MATHLHYVYFINITLRREIEGLVVMARVSGASIVLHQTKALPG